MRRGKTRTLGAKHAHRTVPRRRVLTVGYVPLAGEALFHELPRRLTCGDDRLCRAVATHRRLQYVGRRCKGWLLRHRGATDFLAHLRYSLCRGHRFEMEVPVNERAKLAPYTALLSDRLQLATLRERAAKRGR